MQQLQRFSKATSYATQSDCPLGFTNKSYCCAFMNGVPEPSIRHILIPPTCFKPIPNIRKQRI